MRVNRLAGAFPRKLSPGEARSLPHSPAFAKRKNRYTLFTRWFYPFNPGYRFGANYDSHRTHTRTGARMTPSPTKDNSILTTVAESIGSTLGSIASKVESAQQALSAEMHMPTAKKKATRKKPARKSKARKAKPTANVLRTRHAKKPKSKAKSKAKKRTRR
jgi:hypothetical protein